MKTLAAILTLMLSLTALAQAEQSGVVTSLSLSSLDAAALDIPAADPLVKPAFAKDSWTTYAYGSATILSPDHLYSAHLGAGYYFLDGLSINFEAVGDYVDFQARQAEAGGATWGGGLDLLLRWHFLRGENWSIYADGGAGCRVFGPVSFPAKATHFEFTPQAGVGATARLFNNVNLMGGLRWQHISNAAIEGQERNPGYDAMLVYLGVMLTW